MINAGFKRMTAAFAGILFILLCSSLSAKNSNVPFETFKISLNTAANVNKNIFHEYWDQSPAVDLMIEFPFYTGLIQTGLQATRNSSVKSGVAGYTSIFLYLGWGWEIALPCRLKWYNGVQVGNYEMIFDENRRSDAEKRESELGGGIYSRLAASIKANWSFSIYSSYRKIYTHQQIHHTFIGIGIGYSLYAPRWLREFLR